MSVVNQVLRDLQQRQQVSPNLSLTAVEQPRSFLHSWMIGLMLLLLLGLAYFYIKSYMPSIFTTQDLNPTQLQSTSSTNREQNADSKPETLLLEKTDSVSTSENQPSLASSSQAPVVTQSLVEPENVKMLSEQTGSVLNTSNSTIEIATQDPKLVKVAKTETSMVNSSQLQTKAKPAAQNQDRLEPVKVVSRQAMLSHKTAEIVSELEQVGVEQTLDRLEQLNNAYPKAESIHFQKIKIAWQANHPKTNQYIDAAIQQFPDNASFFVSGSQYYLSLGDHQRAIQLADDFTANHRSLELIQIRALAYQKIGQHLQAIQDYQYLLKQGNEQGGIYLAMGISFESIGEVSRAITSYQKAFNSSQLNSKQIDFIKHKLSRLQG